MCGGNSSLNGSLNAMAAEESKQRGLELGDRTSFHASSSSKSRELKDAGIRTLQVRVKAYGRS